MKSKVSSQLSQVYMLLATPLIDSDGSHQEEEEEEEVKVKGEEGGEGVSVPLTSTSPAAPHKNESEVTSNDSKWIYTHLLILFLCTGAQSTGVKEATTYAGLTYYEEDGAEDLVTFTAARDLNALIDVSMMCVLYELSICCSLLRRNMFMLRRDRIFISVLKLLLNVLN